MAVRLSDRVAIEWFEQVGPNSQPKGNELSVSDVGLIAVAQVTPKDPRDGEPSIAASMYARWNSMDGAHSLPAVSRPTCLYCWTEAFLPATAYWLPATSTCGMGRERTAT